MTGATEWHINADEPDILDYDTSFKPPAQDAIYEPNEYRSSDHDPVIVGLDLLDYDIAGFRSPVDNPPVLNTAKAGSSIPIKFSLGGNLGLDVLFGSPFVRQFACATGVPAASTEPATTGGEGLTYDPASDTYKYPWKTVKSWANSCRTFEITFDDGTYRTANFSFKK